MECAKMTQVSEPFLSDICRFFRNAAKVGGKNLAAAAGLILGAGLVVGYTQSGWFDTSYLQGTSEQLVKCVLPSVLVAGGIHQGLKAVRQLLK